MEIKISVTESTKIHTNLSKLLKSNEQNSDDKQKQRKIPFRKFNLLLFSC